VDFDDVITSFHALIQVEDYRPVALPFTLMVIDFLTGIVNAWATGHIKSYKMRTGLNKYFAEICMVIIGLIFTWTLRVPRYIVYGIVCYVSIMELISICENLDKMGVPIPKFIKSALRNAEYKIQNEDLKKGGDSK
jgi:toxin secretion/phage lysis holin